MIKGKLDYESLPEVYEKLSADLPAEGIDRVSSQQSRKGYDTTGYGYQFHVNRMNEVLFGHWRAVEKVVNEEAGKTSKGKTMYKIVMFMTIQIGNWVTENGESKFEVLMEVHGYGGHESLEEPSDYKGAYTNAFKKASAMLGVGRKAFEGTVDEDNYSVDAQENQRSAHPKQNGRPKQQSKQTQPKKQPNQGKGNLDAWDDLADKNGVNKGKKKSSNPRGWFFQIAKERQLSDKLQRAIIYAFTEKSSHSDVLDEEFDVICQSIHKKSNEQIKKIVQEAIQKKEEQQQGGAA